MLGACHLTKCGTHSAHGRITAVDSSTKACLGAAGCSDGTVLLWGLRDGNFGAVIELPLNGKLHDGASALAFSVAGDVLLLGSFSGGLYRLAFSAHGTQLEELELEQPGTKQAAISSIVRQPEADMFAVATDRCIYILDASGAVHTKIGPLAEAVLQLAWADGSTLIGGTAGAIHTWTQNGSQLGPVLRNLSPSPYLLFSTSPDSHFLAVVCANKEVQCWELGSVLQSQATKVAEPIRLADYESQVDCLEWDPGSRYLATSDGADVTIWDLSDGGGGGCKSSSIACCGHDPKTRVVRMAFQPGQGAMLATASDSSRIVLYSSNQFWSGGVVGPAATVELDTPGDEVTTLRWLSGSRLLAGTASGKLVAFDVGEGEAPQGAEPAPCAAAAGTSTAAAPAAAAAVPAAAAPGRHEDGPAAAVSFAQLSLADRQPKAVRTTPPQQPAPVAPHTVSPPQGQAEITPRGLTASPGRVPPSHLPPAGALPMGFGMPGAMPLPQYPPQVYYTSPGSKAAGPGGGGGGNGGGRRQRQQQQQPSPGVGPYRGAGPEGGATPRTPPASRSEQLGGQPWQQQSQVGSGPRQQGPAPGRGPMSPPAAATRSPFAAPGAAPLRSPAGGNGGGGGGRNGSASRTGSGGGQQHFGMSTSLMQHIQAVRDHPTGRGDAQQHRRPQLAGWGAGQPGGVTAMPWMVMMPSGAPPGAPPGPGAMHMPVPAAAMAYPASAAQAQAYAAQYHAAMMQRMAQGGQAMSPMQLMPGAMPTSPRGLMSPTHADMPGAAHSMPGMGMMAAPPAQWVPYMQQPGQWPGPAPAMAYPGGFMAYPAAAGAASPAYMAAAMQAVTAMHHQQQHQQQAQQQALQSAGSGGPRRQPRGQREQQQRERGGEQRGGEHMHLAMSGGGGGRQGPPTRQSSSGSATGEATQQGEAAVAAAATTAPPGAGEGPPAGPPRDAGASEAASGGGATHHKEGPSCSLGEVLISGGSTLSPTAVADAAAGADSASVPTPGGSADVSVQSTQRGSIGENGDGPVSPAGRTSPRVALSAGPGAGGGALRSHSGAVAVGQRRGSEDVDREGMGRVGSGPFAGSPPRSPVSPGGGVTTVYVGNLAASVDEYALGCTFMNFGPVMHVQVIRDKGTMQSKGFGFVTFAHPAYATLAMQQMDQQVLWGPFAGQRIKVAPSKQGAEPGSAARGGFTQQRAGE